MRAATAAIAAATLVITCAGGMAPTAADTLEVDDWTVTVTVPNTSWSDQFLPGFTPCTDLTILVSTGGTGIGPETRWSLTGEIRAIGAPTTMETFAVPERIGADPFAVTGVQICEHFNAPVPGQWGEYELTGTANVENGSAPKDLQPVGFTVAPMASDTGGMSYSVNSGVNTVTYWVSEVQVASAQTFLRRTSGGSLVVEQLVAGVWTWIADATFQGDGVFRAAVSPPLGSYIRGRFLGIYSVAPSTSLSVQVQAPWPELPPAVSPTPTPTPTAPVAVAPLVARVKVKAVNSRSKLKVDVNPNKGRRYWTFQVQRRNADGTWRALRTYRTRGSTEKRTINLPRGIYRVWVNPKFDHLGAMSAEVTLKR